MSHAQEEIADLRARIAELEKELETKNSHPGVDAQSTNEGDLPLSLPEYRRYGRQMILNGIGLDGQLKLKAASVLVVGAGGLGCPALQYLAAAGVGNIGIVDHDTVEPSNLQRQILHTDRKVGWLKAESAKAAILDINPHISVKTYPVHLSTSNAVSILGSYQLILDCTDNPPTRYLLSDTSAHLGIPLVSGAAMRYDGQLCTYNLPSADSPCYRCVFPKPPKQETVGTCEEVGVLGVVTGVIGTLQAMEAIKIIIGTNDPKPSLLIFSALSNPPFRSIKMRGKRTGCPACGSGSRESIEETDYVAFCGGPIADSKETGNVVKGGRIRAKELHSRLSDRASDGSISIIDTRPAVEFGICHLPGSQNVPLPKLVAHPEDFLPASSSPSTSFDLSRKTTPEIYLVCRQGNDSQVAAHALRQALAAQTLSLSPPDQLPSEPQEKEREGVEIYDVIGGLVAWSHEVDEGFPVY